MGTEQTASIDAEIAAFMAENPAAIGGEDVPDAPADTSADDTPDADAEVAAEGEAAPVEAPEPAETSPAAAVDLSALKDAIAKKDPVALVKALGDSAEELLGAKAHKALRIQVKQIQAEQAKAAKKHTQADDLVKQLSAKYGDPIAARKAAEEGDVDAFVTLVEKWSGHAWNDVMRWATAGMAGRKERLAQVEREGKAQDQMAAAKREQAQAEVKAWVDQGVKKLAPELHDPEVVDMVVAEIRAGFANGITTPAKALPLVKEKLKARYNLLKKVFDGGRGAAPKAKPKAPSAAIERAEVGGKTRLKTLDEEIAEFKRAEGLR